MPRRLATLAVALCVGCGGQTPQEKYETALHIFVMERGRYESMREDLERWPGDSEFGKRLDAQSKRLDRAGKMLDEAEAALPK